MAKNSQDRMKTVSRLRGWFTVQQVAHKLKVSPVRVYQYIHSRRLPAMKFGAQWIINEIDLKAFRRRRTGRPRKGER